jgi:hypothetical protein
MGTATHPQKKNESNQSYAPKQPFKCGTQRKPPTIFFT